MISFLLQPLVAALGAVTLFGLSEALMDQVLKYADPATLTSTRILCSFPFLCILLGLMRHTGLYRPSLIKSPLQWVRALCWLVTATLLAASFTSNDSLTAVYGIFLLHPFWTLLLTPIITQRKVSLRPFYAPIAVMLVGIILYIGGGLNRWPGIAPFLLPLCAGFFFAVTNLFSTRISEELHDGSLITNFYTNTIASFFIPLVLWGVPLISKQEVHITLEPQSDMSFLPLFAFCIAFSAAAALANICEAHAFGKAGNDTTKIAMVDVLIVPLGIGFDYFWNTEIDIVQKLLSIEGLGIALLVASSLFAAIRHSSAEPGSNGSAERSRSAKLRLRRAIAVVQDASEEHTTAIAALRDG